jgi:hypothetical protein
MKLSVEELSALRLPKWPQMRVWGEDVTVEQAKEIIFRTDSFFRTSSQDMGNDCRPNWADWARVQIGLASPDISRLTHAERYDMDHEVSQALGAITTYYVRNSWADSSYVYGAYGWCSPEGKIFYCDNVGKWPSANEILEEWEQLAAAFPFVKAAVVVMSAEHCEASEPVFAIKIEGGAANAVTADEVVMPDLDFSRDAEDLSAVLGLMFWAFKKAGNAVPDDWLPEIAEKIKPVVEKHLRIARGRRASERAPKT